MLVLEALLLAMILGQSALQLEAGVSFTPAELVGPLASFLSFAGLSAWLLRAVLAACATRSKPAFLNASQMVQIRSAGRLAE